MRVRIGGTIVSNDDAALYRRWGYREVCCPQDVRDALETQEDEEGLIFEVNSGGGSVYQGLEMYTLIRDAQRPVTIEIQSIAASAASVFASGGDTVLISPVGNVMVHQARTWTDGNEQDMGKAAQMLRTVDESILNAYEHKCQGKTDRTALRELMENETFLTAQEAVERGFADGIMWENQDAESRLTSSAVAMAGGIQQAFAALPPIDELKRRNQEENCGGAGTLENGAEKNITGERKKKREDETEMELTLENMEQDHKELLMEIRADAAKAERERLRSIEDMGMPGFEDLISAAKEDPEATAQSVAVQIIARQRQQGKAFLKDRDSDAENGGVNGVEGSMSGQGNDPDAELNAALDAAFAKHEKGGKPYV